jgi:hypothetical protein
MRQVSDPKRYLLDSPHRVPSSRLRAGIAKAQRCSSKLWARLLGTALEGDSAERSEQRGGSAFVCLRADAEFQIMLAELRYPSLRRGRRRA